MKKMKRFRVETSIKGMDREPFVDWYQAKNQDYALRIARKDAVRYGLPIKETTFTAREETREEHEAISQ